MIQVIERFHRILTKAVESKNHGVTAKELADMLGISSAACSNILRTMLELKYLTKGQVRGLYFPGPVLRDLATNNLQDADLVAKAKPLFKELAADLGEMVLLVNEKDGKRNELIRVQGKNNILIAPNYRQNISCLFSSTTGILLLAYKSKEARELYWNTADHEGNIAHVQTLEELENICEKIRQNEFFLRGNIFKPPQEPSNYNSALAFPIFKNGEVVAAVGLLIPEFRLTESHYHRIRQECVAVVKKLTLLLEAV